MVPLVTHLLAVGGLALLSAGSEPQRPQEPAAPVLVIPALPTLGSAASTGPAAAKADVIQYMEKEAAFRTKAYPQVRVTNVRFNEDQTWACGVLEHPGERPLVFSSIDLTPQTAERLLALGYLHRAGEWRHERTARREEEWRRECEREGILPQLSDVTEGGAAS